MDEKTWTRILAALKGEVSDGTFKTYFANTRLVNGEVEIPSVYLKNTIEQRYGARIAELLRQETGNLNVVKWRITTKLRSEPDNTEIGPLFETKKRNGDALRKANLKAGNNFENYAVGGSNQMAFAAAQAVARNPGISYNPLFIYGGVGVGKTHLMQAIGHAVLEKGISEVLFCTGEEFTNDLVEAIRYKTTDKVRAKYRKMKLLMIDDVQFIAGKPSIQEEFFHTFNSIQREGGQIVMTSDKPPAEIAKLEERLKSRFGAGLIVDIGPADFELKTAILLIKAKQKGIDLKMEIAQTIAMNIEGVRELEGFLTKLISETELANEAISKDKAEQLLKLNMHRNQTTKIVTPAEVISLIGNFYGVGIQQLKGERRTKMLAWPRQILMYVLHTELKLPLEEVGRLIGGRDHTTVIHACDKVKVELEMNITFQNELTEIKRKIYM